MSGYLHASAKENDDITVTPYKQAHCIFILSKFIIETADNNGSIMVKKL